MTPVKETKEYNRIFRKVLFQVLIDPTRGKLFKDLCEARGEKASAVLRNLRINMLQMESMQIQMNTKMLTDLIGQKMKDL